MKQLFGWFLFFVLCITIFLLLQDRPRGREELPLSDFRDQLAAGNIAHVNVGSDRLHGEFERPVSYTDKSVSHFRVVLPTGTTGNWAFTQWLLENRNGATVDVSATDSLLTNILVPLIPWLLIFGFIWFFVFRQLRNANQKPKEPLPVIVVNPDAAGGTRAPGA